jgi:hypothetical protein
MEEDLEHHDQYSRVLKSKEFWKGFTCDRILLFQSDSVLCSNSNYSLSSFYEYDYIGGPNGNAAKGYAKGRMHLNGGFSFRRRAGMLRCIDEAASMDQDWFDMMPEDAFFSNCTALKQPTPGKAKEFAIDNGKFMMREDYIPFGAHKPWREASCHPCKQENMRLCGGAMELAQDYDAGILAQGWCTSLDWCSRAAADLNRTEG